MKCPKCGYLGFESVDRCRNCGYDFSLASPPLPELPMRDDDVPEGVPDDLDLAPAGPPPAAFAPEPTSRLALDQSPPLASDAPSPSSASELPLFGGPIDDDEPLIKKVSPPRAPLAVRRATPEVPRLRPDAVRPAPLELDLDEPAAAASRRAHEAPWPDAAESDDASLMARFVAVAIDLLLLGAVDALVVYFTLKICGMTVDELSLLPQGPLAAFLVLQNAGYLIAFTAGGQTLGKMAAGIRVVSASGDGLDVPRAAVRTFIWLLLLLPAGLGLLSAVLSRDRRGLHDRLASTRVVRSAAA